MKNEIPLIRDAEGGVKCKDLRNKRERAIIPGNVYIHSQIIFSPFRYFDQLFLPDPYMKSGFYYLVVYYFLVEKGLVRV